MNLNGLYFVLIPLSLVFGGKCNVHMRGNAILNQVVPHQLFIDIKKADDLVRRVECSVHVKRDRVIKMC
jgi:hypothetical protein